jgi:hypothetical protein
VHDWDAGWRGRPLPLGDPIGVLISFASDRLGDLFALETKLTNMHLAVQTTASCTSSL